METEEPRGEVVSGGGIGGVALGTITREDVLRVLGYLLEDAMVPLALRRSAAALEPLVQEAPALGHERLRKLVLPFTVGLPRAIPTDKLFRCLTADGFRRFCSTEEFNLMDTGSFIRLVESKADPDAYLFSILRDSDEIFPAEHSWMVLDASVADLTSEQLRTGLQLSNEPPYVLLVLPLDRVRTNGVTIRPPNAADSIFGPHPQWSPAGIPAGEEVVDGSIPSRAIGETRWRP